MSWLRNIRQRTGTKMVEQLFKLPMNMNSTRFYDLAAITQFIVLNRR